MGRRTTDYKSLAIVCEGSDTEFNYFRSLKKHVESLLPDRFVLIKVIPVYSEIIKEKNPARPSRGKMKALPTALPHYWCMYEHSWEEYDRYSAQPTRYVREAKLYMDDEGYTEAWAVYDKDVHADQQFAREYAKEVSVGIAFSSYSFEEWLLCHFERNPTAFLQSDCEDDNKKSLMCGTHVHPDDCGGALCIAGRLRERGYMPDYTKDSKVFNDTFKYLEKAKINSAWLRHLSTSRVFERNPYTDVDTLVLYMIGDENPYLWCSVGHPLIYNNIKFSVEKTNEGITITYNGKAPLMIHPDKVKWMDDNYRECGDVLDERLILRDNSTWQLTTSLYPFAVLELGGKKIIFSFI